MFRGWDTPFAVPTTKGVTAHLPRSRRSRLLHWSLAKTSSPGTSSPRPTGSVPIVGSAPETSARDVFKPSDLPPKCSFRGSTIGSVPILGSLRCADKRNTQASARVFRCHNLFSCLAKANDELHLDEACICFIFRTAPFAF